MADTDRDDPQDDTGTPAAPEPVVATGDPVPDVPEDVSTNDPEGPGPDVAEDGPQDAPDDPTDDATDDATVADADATPDDATPDDDLSDDDLSDDDLSDDDLSDDDLSDVVVVGYEPDTPAWYSDESDPDQPDAAPAEPLVDLTGHGPGADPEPSWSEDPPLAVHLGSVEPETTALNLRPPAELFREHRRRERRRTLTFLGIFLGVLGMGAASFMFFQGRWTWPFGAQSVSAPICPTPTATGLAPADVSVKVYNAGTRKGLARTIAATMRKRGFLVGEVGNDPQEAAVKGAAIVRHGPEGLDAARTVAAQVDGKVAFVDDGRLSQSVDLVLGTKWTKFRSVAAANKALSPPAPAGPAGCVPASPEDAGTGTGTETVDPTPSAT
jgi:hypothetical protein